LTDGGWVENYTGLYIHWTFSGGAFILGDIPLYVSSGPNPAVLNLTPDVWNSLSYRIDGEGHHVIVNGQTVTVPDSFGRDANVEVSFGAQNAHYDNVEVSVLREE
jgi:hypothetical protein